MVQPNGFDILLVDDEAGIRKILRLFLEMDGFSVREAVSAQQARELIAAQCPDLMVLDVVLCGQTGFEVCEWVKNTPEYARAKVIMFTALNQGPDINEGIRVKADLYLTKPQNPRDIIAEIKTLLNISLESTDS